MASLKPSDVSTSLEEALPARQGPDRGYHFATTAEHGVVREIKERSMCYAALIFERELEEASNSSTIERECELPDGQVITIGNERFRTPEALFKLYMSGSEDPGIHELVHECISKCGLDTHRDLYSNIILSGGSRMYYGLAERLSNEISSLAPPRIKFYLLLTMVSTTMHCLFLCTT